MALAINNLPVKSLEWLEEKICDAYLASGTLTGAEPKVISEGKGFLSTVTKLTLTWKNAEVGGNLPTEIVVKKPTAQKMLQVEMAREMFENGLLKRLHNAEVKAYNYFNLQNPVPFSMPKLIYAEKMTSNDESDGMLILEMVAGRSLTFNEDNTVKQVEALVKEIANLQAFAINYGHMDEYFDTVITEFMVKALAEFDVMAKALRQKYPDEFTMTDAQLAKIRQISEDFFNDVRNPEKLGYPAVPSLTDTQPNNMLWKVNKNDGSLKDEIAAILDFQIIHRGSCVSDLCAVFMWGLSWEDRVLHEERLLKIHWDSLNHHIGSKAPILSFEKLLDEYKRGTCMFAVFYLKFLLSADEMRAQGMQIEEDREKAKVKKINMILSRIVPQLHNPAANLRQMIGCCQS